MFAGIASAYWTLRNAVMRGAAAVALAGFGAAVATFGFAGAASPGTPAAEAAVVVAAVAGKSDRLCDDAHWPPSDGSCLRSLMTRSGRSASVRIVGTGTTVVERPMTDRERIDAVFAAAAPRQALASRDRGGVAR